MTIKSVTRLAASLCGVAMALSACSSPGTPGVESPDTLTGEKTLVEVELTEGTNMAAALSPDGETLILALQGTLWQLPASGGTATALTPAEMDAHEPVWSPDGTLIAFYAYASDRFSLWTMAPDGSDLTEITPGPNDARYPSFSPDGTSLLYGSDDQGGYQVWSIDLETGASAMLTRPDETGYEVPLAPYFSGLGNAVYPTLSPDGGLLAFIVDGEKDVLAVRETDAAGAYRVIHVADKLGAPLWSPDGSALFIAGLGDSVGHVAEIPADGSEKKMLVEGGDVFPFRPSLTPEGDLVYTADGLVKTVSLTGVSGEPIPFSASVTLDRTPYTRRTYDLMDPAPQNALGILDPVLSPDGSSVAFIALGDLWLAELGSGEAIKLTDDEAIDLSPDWSPDGTKIAFASDRGGKTDIWILDLESGAAEQVSDSDLPVISPAWSPDGTKIAHLQVSFVSIFLAGTANVLDLETGESMPVSRPIFGPGPPEWSPDGTKVAMVNRLPSSSRFREGYNGIDLFAVSGDGEEIWVWPVEDKSLGRRQWNRLAWSGDGAIVYRMDGALWMAQLDASGLIGEPTLVAEAGENPAWSGDGTKLIYIDGDDILLYDRETGETAPLDIAPTWSRPVPPASLTIRAGKLFDGTADAYQENVDILIENGVISSILSASTETPDGPFIDASGKAVIPGLIESHTHQSTSDGKALGNLWLSFGITTVRETGDDPYRMTERKEAEASGRRPGPRVFAAGPLNEGARISYGVSETVGTVALAESALDRSKELGLDFFKSYVRQDFSVQKAVIEGAHGIGIPVTSHELYPAVANNVDQLEHFGATSRRGYSLIRTETGQSYQDVIALVSESGLVVTPTLALMSFGGTRDMTAPMATLKRIVDAGGRIVAGTDSPFIPHGDALHTEMKLYVDAGLMPAKVLRTATSDAADALGVGDQLGRLKPGYIADLVILDGDPLVDITDTRKVSIVVKSGSVVYEAAAE